MAAAAASLTPPKLVMTPESYPTSAIRENRSAAAVVKAITDPTGKIASCEVQDIEGDEQLARSLCMILRRTRHRAAKLRDGTGAWGSTTELLRYFLPDTPDGDKIAALRRAADGEVEVSRLPNGASSATVDVVLLIDSEGRVADCGPIEPKQPMELVAAICRSQRLQQHDTVRDRESRPVSYVTKLEFEVTARSSGTS